MINRRCVCGEEFSVPNKYTNYFLSGFDWFGHTQCLANYIETANYSIPVLQVGLPCYLTQPDVYEPRLKMWFRSQIECVFAIWLNYHCIEWRYEEIALQIHGKEYTPDFYLNKSGIFIELKGLWSGNSKSKLIAVREAGIHILLLPHYFKQLLEQDVRKGKDHEIYSK